MFNLQDLSPLQKQLRRRLLEIIYREKQSHLGSCLSALDIMIAVYGTKQTDDRFVLSNGHAGFALYVLLEKEGLLDLASLDKLHIHPDRALEKGMAMADPKRNIYCLISDGECSEGSIWESLRILVEQNVRNLKLIVNVNGWAAYKAVVPQRLKAQFEGFGVKAFEVDGHSIVELDRAIQECQGGESIVFARTNVEQFLFLKGLDAHYYVMNTQDYESAMELLQ